MGCTGSKSDQTRSRAEIEAPIPPLLFKLMRVDDYDTYLNALASEANEVIELHNGIQGCIESIKDAGVPFFLGAKGGSDGRGGAGAGGGFLVELSPEDHKVRLRRIAPATTTTPATSSDMGPEKGGGGGGAAPSSSSPPALLTETEVAGLPAPRREHLAAANASILGLKKALKAKMDRANGDSGNGRVRSPSPPGSPSSPAATTAATGGLAFDRQSKLIEVRGLMGGGVSGRWEEDEEERDGESVDEDDGRGGVIHHHHDHLNVLKALSKANARIFALRREARGVKVDVAQAIRAALGALKEKGLLIHPNLLLDLESPPHHWRVDIGVTPGEDMVNSFKAPPESQHDTDDGTAMATHGKGGGGQEEEERAVTATAAADRERDSAASASSSFLELQKGLDVAKAAHPAAAAVLQSVLFAVERIKLHYEDFMDLTVHINQTVKMCPQIFQEPHGHIKEVLGEDDVVRIHRAVVDLTHNLKMVSSEPRRILAATKQLVSRFFKDIKAEVSAAEAATAGEVATMAATTREVAVAAGTAEKAEGVATASAEEDDPRSSPFTRDT